MFTLSYHINVSDSKAPFTCSKRAMWKSVTIIYVFFLVLSINVVAQNSPQYRGSPPGVPPRQHFQNPNLPAQQDDIKFHDPTEFSQQTTYQQQNEQQLQQLKEAGNHQPPSPNEHKSHGHGIGEAVDADHMKQHDKEEYVDFSKMSETQIVMHHFRQFDLDNNGRVDGLEVFKKIQMDAAEHGDKEQNKDDISMLVKIVDNALDAYDENDDGYIYYAEFHRSYVKLTTSHGSDKE